MKKYYAKKGCLDMKQKRFPFMEVPNLHYNRLRRHVAKIKFMVTEDSIYEATDQGDVLKAGGISTKLFARNNKYAALLGVRYNPTLGRYEVTPYVNHSNGKVDALYFQPIEFGEELEVRISVLALKDDNRVQYHFNNGRTYQYIYFKDQFPIGKVVKSIGNYAGGDKPALEDFSWKQSFEFLRLS